jgi:hypothetical protein
MSSRAANNFFSTFLGFVIFMLDLALVNIYIFLSLTKFYIVKLPWFRVYIIVVNDPGRLILSHIIHTSLVSGWAGFMLIYELLV